MLQLPAHRDRDDPEKSPVYVVFRRIPKQEGQSQSQKIGHPTSELPYCPKVFWAKTFGDLQTRIKSSVFKTKLLLPTVKFCKVENASSAYEEEYKDELTAPDEDLPASEITCLLVFYGK